MLRGSSRYLGGSSKRAKSFSTCTLNSDPGQPASELNVRHSASDDLAQPAVLRSLLKDLREVRQAKIRIGLQSEGVMRGSYLQVRAGSDSETRTGWRSGAHRAVWIGDEPDAARVDGAQAVLGEGYGDDAGARAKAGRGGGGR